MSDPKRVTDNCYLIEPRYDRTGAALPLSPQTVRDLSARTPGVFYLGTYYYNHVEQSSRGSKPGVVYLRGDEYEPISDARRIVEKLTGCEPRGWTYSQLAREVTEWLEIRQPAYQRARELVADWHYQKCVPFDLDHAELYDMKSAYWQVVSRVQSPKFDLSADGSITWHLLSPFHRRRWDAMRELCGAHKKLRLAIVGVNAAGWSGGRQQFHGVERYRKGKREEVAPLQGALQPMSVLSVRVVYELTQMQADATKTVYANSDCVVVGKPDLRVWDSWRIEYSCKARGRCSVNQIGSWRIGDKQTRPFAERGYLSAHIPRRVQPVFHQQALAA